LPPDLVESFFQYSSGGVVLAGDGGAGVGGAEEASEAVVAHDAGGFAGGVAGAGEEVPIGRWWTQLLIMNELRILGCQL